MKIDRTPVQLTGNARTATIELPATRAFSTATLDDIGRGLGRVGLDADRASIQGGDGGAKEVDGYVTEAESHRFLTDFANEGKSKVSAHALLQLFKPQTAVDVTLPKAIAPVTLRHTMTFPDGAARLKDLPEHLKAAAHVAIDVAQHIDDGAAGHVERSLFNGLAVVNFDDIDTALAHVDSLRNATNDVVAEPKAVAQLKSLQEHLTTASTTQRFVPQNPPEYAAPMPLKSVKLELVTFGTLQTALPIGPAGRPGTTHTSAPQSFDGGRVSMNGTVTHTQGTSQAYAVEVNRYFQLQAPEGLTVVLKTETAGPSIYGRPGLRTSELVLDGQAGKKQNIIDLAGIAEGAPTTLVALVFDGEKLVESAQIKLPHNPIVERATEEGKVAAVKPVAVKPGATLNVHGTTITSPGLLSVLLAQQQRNQGVFARDEAWPHEPKPPRFAERPLLAALTSMSSQEATVARAELQALARRLGTDVVDKPIGNSELFAFGHALAEGVPKSIDAALAPLPHAAFLREVIGPGRVTGETAEALVGYFKRYAVNTPTMRKATLAVANDLLLFSRSELSAEAVSKIDGFLNALYWDEVSWPKRIPLVLPESLESNLGGKFTRSYNNVAPLASFTVQNNVELSLPTTALRELMDAALLRSSVVVHADAEYAVVARYEPSKRRFEFELHAAAGQPAISGKLVASVDVNNLWRTRTIPFSIEVDAPAAPKWLVVFGTQVTSPGLLSVLLAHERKRGHPVAVRRADYSESILPDAHLPLLAALKTMSPEEAAVARAELQALARTVAPPPSARGNSRFERELNAFGRALAAGIP